MNATDRRAESGAYFTFVNRSRKLARVHRADCTDCNSGTGKHGVGRTINGWWSDPFKDYESALAYAEKYQPRDARACKTCL